MINDNDGFLGFYKYVSEDVIRLIHLYCDIPTLYGLSMTCQEGYNLTMRDDLIWRRLIQFRFGLNCNVYNGRNFGQMIPWRERYRQWSICQRPPKSLFRQPNRMMVLEKIGNNKKEIIRHGKTHSSNYGVAIWVTLGHTDNCQTKSISSGRQEQRIHRNKKCIELRIGLQIVKSSSAPILVDFRHVKICMLDERSKPYMVPVISSFDNSNYGHYDSKKNHDTDVPKCLLHKYYPKLIQTTTNYEHDCELQSIDLKPFDFVVASVHVPTYVQFETDFLSRAVDIQIPVKYCNDGPIKMIKSNFISESNIWKYYQELPGRCISLITSSHTFTP